MNDPATLVERLIGARPVASRALSGGDLSAAWLVQMAEGHAMVLKRADDAAIQARMLRAMAATGAPVPQVIAGDGDLLLMDHIASDGGPGGSFADLAQVLLRLHAPTAEAYGWPDDHGFGTVAIGNRRSAHWPTFWAEHRLLNNVPHVAPALARRLEALAAGIGDVLPAAPAAALLHGDLWGGNVLCRGGRVAGLIDPSCHYGHREVDWAMLTMFDHPPERFFAAMQPETGWRDRLACYRLWPGLVHLRLFGDGYRGGVERDLAALGY